MATYFFGKVAKLHKLTGYEQNLGLFFRCFRDKMVKKWEVLDEKGDFGDKGSATPLTTTTICVGDSVLIRRGGVNVPLCFMW
ncbi:MAG: hypothetical protein ABIQ40_04320 [Bacteroidia bacterium]